MLYSLLLLLVQVLRRLLRLLRLQWLLLRLRALRRFLLQPVRVQRILQPDGFSDRLKRNCGERGVSFPPFFRRAEHSARLSAFRRKSGVLNAVLCLPGESGNARFLHKKSCPFPRFIVNKYIDKWKFLSYNARAVQSSTARTIVALRSVPGRSKGKSLRVVLRLPCRKERGENHFDAL